MRKDYGRLDSQKIYGYVVHMKSSNISYLRDHLSEVLSCVKEGETVLVLDRKKPVARLVPHTSSEKELSTRLQELQQQGMLTHTPSDTPRKPHKPIKLHSSVDVVQYLLDDRDPS